MKSSTTKRSVETLLSIIDGYAVFAPDGSWDLHDGIAFVTEAVRYCKTQNIRGLIVDVRQVIGLKNPSVAEKFWYTQDWAKASGGKVAIALVANRDLIDPTKIGVTMAENVGLRSHVFDNREDAVEWLKRYL